MKKTGIAILAAVALSIGCYFCCCC